MHPRIAELEQFLDQQRAMLTADVAHIAVSRRRDPPGAGRWSVVNVLEHLAIVERRIGTGFGGWVTEAKAQELAKETDTSPILPTINSDRFVDRSRPIKTSAAGEPTNTVTVDEALHSLSEARAAFKEAIAGGDGYALGTVSRPHPVFGPLTLYEWIAFVGGHMERHAMQIREIGVALAGAP